MFATVKYIGVDYFYEDKNYCHDGRFADDKYRRPWTRVSIDSTQMTFSMLDLWKECFYIEDFLEKKPISSTCFHIHNEDDEIIPSSNPNSQLDTEAYILTKDDEKQELISPGHLQSSSAPEVFKDQGKGLFIEDELVFTDCLMQYTKRLPTLRTLLNRLNIFYVEDPILDSEGDRITEEDIFRECFTFKRSVTLIFKEELCEDFCKMPVRDEETLVLPIQLPFYKAADFSLHSEIPTYLALKSLFHVMPEFTGDENEHLKINSDDFKVNITPETMGISDCCSMEDMCGNKNRSVLEFSEPASYISFHPKEIEVPLTPPSKTEKLHINLLCPQLQPEPVSPFGQSAMIPESTAEYLENIMWQSEKYQHPMNSLLLTDHQNFVPLCQQLSIIELKTLLSVHDDISVFSSLEENEWINFREKMASPCTLEVFSTDLRDGEKHVSTPREIFSKTDHFQLTKCLEENITVEHFGVLEYSGEKDSPLDKEMCSPFCLKSTSKQYNTAAAADSTPSENHVRETQLGREVGKPLSSGNQEGKNVEFQLVGLKDVSVGPHSTPKNKRPISFELPRKSQDDFDLLSNFIMLRSKHVITQSEKTNSVDVQEEGSLSALYHRSLTCHNSRYF